MKTLLLVVLVLCCSCDRKPVPSKPMRMGETVATATPSPFLACLAACPSSPVDGEECRSKCPH